MWHRQSVIIIFLIILSSSLAGQSRFVVSGYLTDGEGGEYLEGASVFLADSSSHGVYSDERGFYTLSLDAGAHTLVFSYLGFKDVQVDIFLDKDKRMDIILKEGILMEEVLVSGREADKNVSGNEMGTIEMGMEEVSKLPSLMGEVDVLKVIQLLPGVLSAGEGNSGFYVRGGGPDQNLVLLDDATIYNTGHLLGFFSVFNPDVIDNTTLIKGGIPAAYGGRLSSVVDISTIDGNEDYWEGKGGLGLLSSRLTVGGPINKGKGSMVLGGRRAYAFQLAQPFLKGTPFEGTNYHFYDVNGKAVYKLSEKDRIRFSGYLGQDILRYRSQERGFSLNLSYGNKAATLSWNHLFNEQLSLRTVFFLNEYDFQTEGEQSDFSFDLFSGVQDRGFQTDITYVPNEVHHYKFGIQYINHKLTPNVASASSNDVVFKNTLLPKYGHEVGIYLQDELSLSDRLSMNVGLRYSFFEQVGPYRSISTGKDFAKGERVADYGGFEPRWTGRYQVGPNTSLKVSFTRGRQYLHLVSTSTSTLPFDVWVPSSENVKPQIGNQYALGYFRNFAKHTFELSLEAYYKGLENQIDFRDGYINDINKDVEESFVYGQGRAYGLELFIKKKKGLFNGWLGYTLSRSERSFEEIENGRYFPAIYDRTHDFSLVLNYDDGGRWDFGLVYVYGTGRAFTPLESVYFIEQRPIVHVGSRNSARFDAYHRLDLSATLEPVNQRDKDFFSSWTFSVYNVYNRLNPLYIFTTYEGALSEGSVAVDAVKVSIFPIIPSVTWNFKWKGKTKKAGNK